MQIGMLGAFEVRTDDGDVVDVPGARLRGLLIALALRPGHAVPRASLVDWLWGEHPPADATNALQRLVSRLRKVLPAGSIEGRPNGYLLTVGPDAVDAVRFEHLVARSHDEQGAARAHLLREALGLWRGAALQDVDLPESDALGAAAARLEERRLTATEDRFDADAGGSGSIPELTDLVAAHPLRERLAAALMRALGAAGRDAEALLVFERIREALADALGVDPSPDLAAVHVALLRGDVRRHDDRRTNVRAAVSSFVGRELDVVAVGALVAQQRLITLIGPGGSGKTRLATETAATVAPPDGVWLVELAAVGADGDVAQATLAGLDLRDTLLGGSPDTEPTDRLVTALRERELLLILDNCEHVIEQVAAFAERLLGECRSLRILATSREPLGITGEALWPVEPLAVAPAGAGPDEIASSSAVRLLRDRAGAVRRDVAVDARTLATAARVCRALDGMPLAIELAAARLRTMSLDQLADRLDDRFRLLTGGSRTALPRHRTLRAVVDWSWELLTDAERTVLRRLATFSGGAGLDAAERVCSGDTLAPTDVLELLTSLTEKSLLVADGDGDGAPRYRMLGTIKEYAAQRLAEAGETDLVRLAHLAYVTELAETAEPHLRRAEQLTWLAALEAEHDNIGAAMRGALASGEAQAAMRLAAAAGFYWWLGGRRAEGLELLVAAADLPGEVTDDVRAMTYGMVAYYVSSGRGDEYVAAEWIRRAYRFSMRSRRRNPLLDMIVPMERLLSAPDDVVPAFEALRDSADPWVGALARWQVAKMRTMHGQGDQEPELERALAEFRALGERFGTSLLLSQLAAVRAGRGDLAGACDYLDEAIVAVTEIGAVEDVIELRTQQAALLRLSGDQDGAAAAIDAAERIAAGVTWPYATISLALAKAELARLDGDAEEARDQLGLAAGLLGDATERPYIRASIHDLIGYIADDLDEARTHRAAACRAAAESGIATLTAQVLVGVADLALRENQHEQAARLLGASAGLRGGPDRSHPDAARIERTARDRLGDAGFAEATLEGTRADWAELVAVTLGEEFGPTATPRRP